MKPQTTRVAGVCIVLVLAVLAVFGQTAGFGFVCYDDDQYVYHNPVVEKGLTVKGFVWALTYGGIGHWHPLTWLTHMANCQIYGLWPGGHHLTNVALQAATAVLLFLALRELTGTLWRSAFVAAVFAIHPLRAESVAWISECKDVLSGVFFMLTLWAYARYARQPSSWRYATVAAAYALGLLCKNTLVTLPFVLLLLDWWPLHRLTLTPFWRLVKEKIPLFLLSVGSCAATILAPEGVADSIRMPPLERIENAGVSYVIYLRQMIFPRGLAALYPNPPKGLPFPEAALAFVLLAAISFVVLACWKKRPWLLAGWLWYLGMLVPMIGIVQISFYAHADRYTYLPQIGIYVAVTWLVAEWRMSRVAFASLTAGVLAILMVCAWKQTAYWKNSETLWNRTLACTTNNEMAHYNFGNAFYEKGSVNEAIAQYRMTLQINPGNAKAHYNLGLALFQMGRGEEAISHFLTALRIKPDMEEAHNNLGIALFQTGKADEAVSHFLTALQLKPDDARACYNLGNAYYQRGRVDEAIVQFQQALQLEPGFAEAHYSLGNALRQKGRLDEAIVQYQEALQLKPSYGEVHNNLGAALQQKGRVAQAIEQYQSALQIEPGNMEAQNNLAWLLATSPQTSLRNGAKALELARQANDLAGGKNPVILGTLAAALAEVGRFGDAVQSAQKAIELAQAAGRQALVSKLNGELRHYEAGLPLHR
ncbi:MAG: tetratricopeptide repeat protein [Verrucomicrobiota bacterium]|jgi:tetratricopeptide (TPR) repeat protein